MSKRVALITGITGQDGYYLSQFLLEKEYRVHGFGPCSSPNTPGIEALASASGGRLLLHHADVTDTAGLIRLIRDVAPAEIYNLAAQSHVQVSFEAPKLTTNINAMGVLRILEAIRLLGLERKVRFYQASTSELYGKAHETPQRETTPFYPRSPYAVAKLYAYWMVVNYREAYGLHASNGILFNHESPMRGETFVTRKITRAAAAISQGRQETLYLGNLEAQRDWGHARDYVEGMWLMLQQDCPDDYVLATGTSTHVRTFAQWAFEDAGITLRWEGEGVSEKGFDDRSGALRVAIDPKLFRPAEVDAIIGDAKKAREKLGWSHKIPVRELAREMVMADLAPRAI